MKTLEKNDTVQKPINSNINKMGLTENEQLVHDKLIECFDAFLKLEFQHPEDTREFCYAVHLIQGLLTMRIARRQYPEGWVTYHIETVDGEEKTVIDEIK